MFGRTAYRTDLTSQRFFWRCTSSEWLAELSFYYVLFRSSVWSSWILWLQKMQKKHCHFKRQEFLDHWTRLLTICHSTLSHKSIIVHVNKIATWWIMSLDYEPLGCFMEGKHLSIRSWLFGDPNTSIDDRFAKVPSGWHEPSSCVQRSRWWVGEHPWRNGWYSMFFGTETIVFLFIFIHALLDLNFTIIHFVGCAFWPLAFLQDMESLWSTNRILKVESICICELFNMLLVFQQNHCFHRARVECRQF